MSVDFTKKTWYDGSEGGTPITAAELNRVETGIDDVVTQSNADKTNIDTHIAKKVNSSDGAHGLRYYNSELDYYDDTNEEWVEIQTGGGGTSDYENLLNKPSINGVELLGNKAIGLLSGNIQVDSDKIGYNNAISGLSATNVKSAIDELANSPVAKTNIEAVYEETTALSAHSVNEYIYMNNLLYRVTSAISIGDSIVVNTNVELADDIEEGTEAYISNLPGSNVPNYPDLTNKPSINGVELLGNKLVGLLSTDIHINADKIGYSGTVSGASTTKAAIDALQSSLNGLHGIPSGGNTNQVLAKNSSSDYDLKWVNQTGGGGVGTVVNLTTTDSNLFNQTVTLTGTYATYTATFDNTGHASVNVYYVGTYDIACEGFHNSVNVTAMGLVLTQGIDEDYCTVNITTSIADLEGETIDIYYGTDSTDIRAQLTFDSTLALSFRATQSGDYNIAWASASTPQTFTVSALSGSMSVTYTPIPIGASVTPVNDIQTWLNCAAIFDKNYTTISQVLSDTTTLQTLISSNNANDYLVRSTSWVSNVCGNSTAMSYIGLNNYSANTLLADSTWCTTICNSTYFESVLNVKVPTMTSDTTPSGRVVYSSQYNNTNYAARNVFDGNLESTWNCAQSEYEQTNKAYVGYMFPSAVKILFARITIGEGASNYEYRLIGSDNGASWDEISLANTGSTYSEFSPILYVTAPTTRQYYGVRGSHQVNGNTYAQLIEVQFYGRADV